MEGITKVFIVLGLIFFFIIGFALFEYQFNTKPIRQECKDFGYEGAYHSNRGWYCWKEENGLEVSASYLDLKDKG